ncbi:MAG: transglycosylase SLT domain-containing protein [Hyphomicrobiales bacterium]|nr:transglycosylase SLT domain-containing protein [Hyphomicrobiales bacterium]
MALVSPVEAPLRVSDAIKKASAATGTDFSYLLTTAARESNFQPQAKAKTSSAAGLFQFIENTWLQTVKEEGGRFGLEKYSPHIFKTSSGRYYVPDREIRSEVLKLRHDPEVSAMMAGAFTQQNAEYVGSRLGRKPNQGELYIAHFLGPAGATKLISLAENRPSARADAQFPKAAAANRGIFYSYGKARSVSQVYEMLVSDHSRMESLAVANADPVRANGSGNPETVAEDESAAALLKQVAEVPPSGLVAKTRVAALSKPALVGSSQTMNDAGLGSIGAWTTIVERADPATTGAGARERAPIGDAPAPISPQIRVAAREPAAPVKRGAAKRAAPISLPQRRPAPPAVKLPAINPIKIASSAIDVFQSDYWMNASLSGS